VFTENTPPEVMQPRVSDNQFGYLASVPLTVTASFLTLQTYDPSHTPHNFFLDLPVSGVNAIIQYFVFDANQHAFRQGVLNVVWNSTMVGAPVLIDTSVVAVGSTGDLQWTATYTNPHVVLQYINQTGGTPTVYFRLDRPSIV
jgi:hypothetical protein